MVDIKTDYGAVGNGQIATVTASFTSGSQNLAVASNTFVSGDVGKYIVVQGWVAANGSNPAGALVSTISSVGPFSGGSQTIVLADNAQETVTATVSLVEWGTDDTPAFSAFNTAQAGNSGVVLTIPAGRYCMVSGPGGSLGIGRGVKSLTVNGSGNPVLTDMLGAAAGFALNYNGAPLFNDNTAESFVQSVGRGSTVLPMVTVSDAAKYSPNTWAWMTGYDVQGFGNPPNFYWAEFVYITAVDTVGGTVTIQGGLKNSYRSTWPGWVLGSPGIGPPSYTGGSFSLGGPGKLYLINQAWVATQVWNNVGFRSTPTLFNAGIQNLTLNNPVFESYPVNVSMQQYCTVTGTTVAVQWELDKGTEQFTLVNSTVHGFRCDNPSPFNVVLDGVTIASQWPGSSRNLIVRNSSFPAASSFGMQSYGGSAESAAVFNTVFAGDIEFGGVGEDVVSGDYSCSNGLITRPFRGGIGEPPQWAIPGRYFIFGGRYHLEDAAWKVVDIWTDGTTLYIQTDQSGGFPTGVTGADVFARAAPPALVFAGNTGCDTAMSWSNVTPSKPQYTQWDLTYSGNIGSTPRGVLISGQVISIIITVAVGYTAGTFNLDGPFVVEKPGNTETIWNPSVDLTVAGARTITPSGVTGGGGADSGLALPNGGNIWLVDNQIGAVMSGAAGTGSVRLQIQTNLGMLPLYTAPVGLRLHA